MAALSAKEREVRDVFETIFQDETRYGEALFSDRNLKELLQRFRDNLVEEVCHEGASFDHPKRSAEALLRLRQANSLHQFNKRLSSFEKEMKDSKTFPSLKTGLATLFILSLSMSFLCLGFFIHDRHKNSGFAEFLGLGVGPILMFLTIFKGMSCATSRYDAIFEARNAGALVVDLLRKAHERQASGDTSGRGREGSIVPFFQPPV